MTHRPGSLLLMVFVTAVVWSLGGGGVYTPRGWGQTRVIETDLGRVGSIDMPDGGEMGADNDLSTVEADEGGSDPAAASLWLDHEEWLRLNMILRRFIEEGRMNLDRMIELDQRARRLKGQLTIETNRARALKLERDDLKRRVGELAELGRTVQEQALEERSRLLERIADLERRIKEAEAAAARRREEAASAPPERPSQGAAGSTDAPSPEPLIQETAQRRIRVLDAAAVKTPSPASSGAPPSQDVNQAGALSRRLAVIEQDLSAFKHSIASFQDAAADVHYNMGNAFFRRGQYRRAYDEYKKAVALAPSDADAHFNLAFVAGDYLREYRTALRHFREYLMLKPDADDRRLVKEKITEYELYVRGQIDSHLEDELKREFQSQHLQDDSAPPKRR